MSNNISSNSVSKTNSNLNKEGLSRHDMIEAKAYSLASDRDFTGDNHLNDWLEAEKEVDGQLPK
ncbi:DUF2934 domain-containing protein [Pseudoalteromonas sp. APC 3358]|uniref:DUF2934 domain-containing protein n=1 Tax=Pseudoalteromonas sp. APC 3358 TaxID=3035176 RepID=UPI0025B562B5|nr:DUF2934 domain-containing protein [Pseudoalteromonas sp. APC 3358]MDN3382533.1 DUF2934 domain-containing protein [Pseudoalteromonas sp. APC 3358]